MGLLPRFGFIAGFIMALCFASGASASHVYSQKRNLLQGGDFGDECTADSECTGSLYCVNEGGLEWCGYKRGDSCANNDECGGNLSCNDGGLCDDNFGDECAADSECTGSLYCVNEGGLEWCGYKRGDSCANNDECGGNLSCNDGGLCDDNFGDECAANSECTGSLYCVNGTCDKTGTDIPPSDPTLTSPPILPTSVPTMNVSPSPRQSPPLANLNKPNAPGSTPSRAPPVGSSTDTSGGSNTPVAAIVGGVVGGILLLLLLVAVLVVAKGGNLPRWNHSNMPWPPREFVNPAQHAGYAKFWANGSKWTPFLSRHGDISPTDLHEPEHAGVYEFGLVHPLRRNIPPVVVYVGKAGGQQGIRQRHQAYRKDGDHLNKLFQIAFKHQCQIWRRWVVNPQLPTGETGMGDRWATQMETRCLSFFDYAYNIDSNVTEKGKVHARSLYIMPRNLFYCIPAGISICNENPEPPYPRQVPTPGGCFCDESNVV